MSTERILCRCQRVTEEEVITSIRTRSLRTVKEVRDCTGAGDGCTCCLKAVRKCLELHAATSSSHPLVLVG